MKSPTLISLALVPTITLAATISQRDISPATPPSGWTYVGCFNDSTSDRSINSAFYTDGAMTGRSCIAFCASKSYGVAGTEYSSECYCGVAISQSLAATDGCNMACSGQASEVCGGSNRLTVYRNPSLQPSTNSGPTGWNSLGCYTDNVSARTLPKGVSVSDNGNGMTVSLCTSTCKSQGYKLAGVEYANECYCGNSFENGGAPATDGCNMSCKGKADEFCGGSNRLNVYQVNDTITSTSSSSPASPTTTPATGPSCVPTITTGGQIVNGGFESGISPWTNTANNVQISQIYGSAYEGCYALGIQPSASDSNTQHIAVFNSNSGITLGTTHQLTFYAGRRSATAGTSTATIVAQVQVASGTIWSQSFSSCQGPTCDLQGANGSVWKKYTASISVLSGSTLPLSLAVTYLGATANDGSDDILFDGFLVV